MSNKRIRKGLDKLFDGLKEGGESLPRDENQAQAESDKPYSASTSGADYASTSQEAGVQTYAVQPVAVDLDTASQPAMSLVFRTQDQDWNTLQVIDETPGRVFGNDEQLLVKQVIDQLTLALQNANLFQQTQRQAAELAILNEMGRELVTQLNVDQILESVYKYTSRMIDTFSFFIALYNETQQELNIPFIINDGRRDKAMNRKLGNGLTDYVIRSRQPLLITANTEEKMRELGLDIIRMGTGELAKCWLGVPMAIGTQIIGVITVQSVKQERLYDEHQRDLLSSVASQAAIAIQNARLFQQTQQQNAELAVLNEMGNELSSLQSVEGVAEIVYQYTGKLMDVTNIFIAQYHPENNEMSFPLVYFDGKKAEVERQSVGNGLTAYIIKTRQPLFIPENLDETTKKLGLQSLNVADEDPALCWLGVPMILGQQTYGVIALQSTLTSHLYTERHRDLLIAIASQAAIAIENARLFEETRTRAQELSMLNELGRVISGELDRDRILRALSEQVLQILQPDGFAVGLYNSTNNTLHFAIFYENGEYQPEDEGPLEQFKFSSQIIKTRQPLLVLRSAKEVETEKAKRASDQLPPSSSMIYAPIAIGADIMGVISVESYRLNAYGQNQVSLIENISNQLAVALQNAQYFEETRKRANELATLNEIMRTVSEQIELQQVLESTFEQVRKLVPTDAFFVALYDEEANTISYPFVIDEGKLYQEGSKPFNPDSYSGRTIVNGEYILDLKTPESILDADTEITTYIGNTKKESASLLFLPLKVGTKSIGVLSIQSYQFSAYKPEDINLLKSIANQLVVAIQNARLFEQEQYRRQVADTLSEMARIAGSTLNLDEVVQRLLEQLPKLVEFHTASIQLISPDGSRKQIGGVSKDEDRLDTLIVPADFFLRPTQDDPLINEVVTTRKPVLIPDTSNDPRWDVLPETEQVRSWMCAPLSAAEKVIGLLILDDDTTGTYNTQMAEVVQSFAAQAAIAIQNANLFTETQAKEENFRNLIENAPEAIVVVNTETLLFEDPNENAALLFGLSREELSKYGPGQLSAETQADGRPTAESAMEKIGAALAGETQVFEWLHKNAEGKIIPCEIHLARLPGDRPLVRATIVDITERKLAEAVLDRRARQLQAISEISSATSAILEEQRLLETFVQLTQRSLGLYHAHILMLQNDQKTLENKACGWKENDANEGTVGDLKLTLDQPSIVTQAARSRAIVIFNDVHKEAEWRSDPKLPDVQSEMAIPVIAASGHLLGVLNIHSERANAFSSADVAIFNTLASQIGTSIQNVRQFVQAQDRARREQLLREITARVRGSTDPDTILRTAVREVGQAFGMQTFIRLGKESELAKGPEESAPQPVIQAPDSHPPKKSRVNRQSKKAEGDK